MGEKRSFFEGTRPGTRVSHGVANFELPILYFRDDFFGAFFSADEAALRAVLPSDNLHPLTLGRGRALFGIGAFNYLDTSVGPYGEVGVVVPVVHGKRPLPFVPALLEARYPGFGAVVLHLPVTKRIARDAGRGEWGYTKFVADMQFVSTPEHHECQLSEGAEAILTLRVKKGGTLLRDERPLVTYSVKDAKLVRTTIPQRGVVRARLGGGGSWLSLGDHPVAREIAALRPSRAPIFTRYYVERSGILPAGEVVEEGVRPLDGYRGQDREGTLAVGYLGE